MKFIIKTILSLFLTVTQLSLAYPVYVSILHHPQTGALIGIIGDEHYNPYKQQSIAAEMAFENTKPLLEKCINNTFKIIFESNARIEQKIVDVYKKNNSPSHWLGLHGLILKSAQNISNKNIYIPGDARKDSVDFHTTLFLHKKKIIEDLYEYIIETLNTMASQSVNIHEKQRIQLELLQAKHMTIENVVNTYLYTLHNNLSIPSKNVKDFLKTILCKITKSQPEEIERYRYHNLLLDSKLITNSLYNMLLPYLLLQHPYKNIAQALHKRQELCLQSCLTFIQSINPLITCNNQLTESIIHLGALYNNSLEYALGKKDKNKSNALLTKMYNHLMDTIADTTFAAHTLQHKKVFLYTGSDHSAEVEKVLCTHDNGFKKIYSNGRFDDQAQALTEQDLTLFYTTIAHHAHIAL